MPLSPPDAELIVRVLERDDRHAFSELVRRHQSVVRGLLRRLTCGDLAQADDLSQETFIRAYRGLRNFRGGARFSTWLHRIAYNVFLTAVGKAKAHPTAALDETRAADADQSPAADGPDRGPAERSLLRLDLSRAMRDLSPAERLALTLAYGRDHSHAEVAAILDCPLGTVKTHIARGKEKLRRRLGAWESEDSP